MSQVLLPLIHIEEAKDWSLINSSLVDNPHFLTQRQASDCDVYTEIKSMSPT